MTLGDLKQEDILSRFIHKSSHISWVSNPQSIKTCLFSESHPMGYSVFLTTNLDEKEIKLIEETYVKRDKPAYGRCDIEAQFYDNAGLVIEKDDLPPQPPRHYNIHGMPIRGDLTDANNLNLRQQLVSKAKLVIYNFKT